MRTPLGDGDFLTSVILRCSGGIVCAAALIDVGSVAGTRVSVSALVDGGGVIIAVFLVNTSIA